MTPGTSLRRSLAGVAVPLAAALMLTAASLPLLESTAQAEDKTAARDHWERGTKFYDLGKYDDAIREFEAAYEAKGDPAFLYNLAQSHRLAGHPVESLRFYRTYLRYVPKAANRADIELRINELEKTVAERPGGESPSTVPPPAGSTTITPVTPPPPSPAAPSPTPSAAPSTSPPPAWQAAPAPGYTQPPPVDGSGNAVSSSAPAEPAPVAQKSGRKTAGIVIAAAGGGLFVVGAVFGLVAKSQSSKVESAGSNEERFDPSVESLGKTSETLQWVGYGIGMAAIATGIVLFVTAPGQTEAAQPPRVAVAPLAGPGSGGALLRVSF